MLGWKDFYVKDHPMITRGDDGEDPTRWMNQLPMTGGKQSFSSADRALTYAGV